MATSSFALVTASQGLSLLSDHHEHVAYVKIITFFLFFKEEIKSGLAMS